MPILSKCCCCSLQAGVITIGVLGLIFPTILTGVCIWIITLLGVAHHGANAAISENEKQLQDIRDLGNAFGKDIMDDPEFKSNMDQYEKDKGNFGFLMGLGWAGLIGVTVVLIFLIIMNILLIVGACKDKAKLLLPWMGYNLLAILGQIILALALFVGKGFNVYLLIQSIFTIGIVILVWLCVFSLYQEINERRQNQTYQQPMQKM